MPAAKPFKISFVIVVVHTVPIRQWWCSGTVAWNVSAHCVRDNGVLA